MELGAMEELMGLRVASAVARVETLTPKEREVLALMARGATSASIAAELSVSTKALDIHRANLMHKLKERAGGRHGTTLHGLCTFFSACTFLARAALSRQSTSAPIPRLLF
jgi:DNA-binding CsgD family transcriptional regulator